MYLKQHSFKPLMLVCVISSALYGCSGKQLSVQPAVSKAPAQEPTNTTIPPAKGHIVNECDSIQRDLSRPWQLRQYWCAQGKQKKKLQTINDTLINLVIDNPSYKREEPAIKTISRKPIASEPVLPESTVVSPSSKAGDLPAQPVTSTNSNHSFTPASIIFAHHIKVLGPTGRSQASALLGDAKLANKVLLRGLIQPDEIMVDSAIYKEKVSVARALAVRKLWEGKGMDISKVKILHYSPDRSGRSVEVTFRG